MIHDTLVDINDPENLSSEQCKEWWEKKQQNQYFDPDTLVFHFSKPELIEQMNLTKDSFVLEMGGGHARETKEFCKLSDNVYNIDISKTAAELNKKNAPEVKESKEYNGYDIPFDDDMFDLAYNCFVIQHMSKKDAYNLIKDTKRVLKKGGKFLFEFLGGNYIGGETQEHYSGGPKGGMFNNGYTVEEVRKIMQELGYEEVFINEYQVIADGTTNVWACGKKV